MGANSYGTKMTRGDWERDPKLGSRTQRVIWTLNPLSIFPVWTLTPLSIFPARLLSRLLQVNTNVGSHVTRCKRSLSTIPCHASQKFNEVRTCTQVPGRNSNPGEEWASGPLEGSQMPSPRLFVLATLQKMTPSAKGLGALGGVPSSNAQEPLVTN
jgi:hypothetical protein